MMLWMDTMKVGKTKQEIIMIDLALRHGWNVPQNYIGIDWTVPRYYNVTVSHHGTMTACGTAKCTWDEMVAALRKVRKRVTIWVERSDYLKTWVVVL